MINDLKKFRTTVLNGLLAWMTIEHIHSLCVQFGSIDAKMPESAFLQAIQEKAFPDSNLKTVQRAVDVMFCLKEPSMVMMRVRQADQKGTRTPAATVMLLSDLVFNAMLDRKTNALVGLNLLREAISLDAIDRKQKQIAILDAGHVAVEASNNADLIMSGMKAWIAMSSACADGALEIQVYRIKEPSPFDFNNV